MTSLASLSVAECAIEGPIPSELGNLASLQELWLYGNQLTGNIPPELGNLLFMSTLELQGNLLNGPMPDEVCDLTMTFLGKLGADCDNTVSVFLALALSLCILLFLHWEDINFESQMFFSMEKGVLTPFNKTKHSFL